LNKKVILVVAALALLMPGAVQAQPAIKISRFVLQKDTCLGSGICIRAAYTWLDDRGLWTGTPPHPNLAQSLWSGGLLYFSSLMPITRVTFTYEAPRGARVLLNGVEVDLPASRAIRRYSANVAIPVGTHWLPFRFRGSAFAEVDTGQGLHGA
jgi:hypothetical protein